MMTEIMAIDTITDELLKAIGHQEDCRVQLLATREGMPIAFACLPGEANDVRGLNACP